MEGSEMHVVDLAVIGAGPVGLEAAAHAAESGLEAAVFEAGDVASHVERWGAVRLFSPFALNAGPAGKRLLDHLGTGLPAADEIMTGAAFRTSYLLPLASALRDSVELREYARVRHVTRARWLKGEALGSPARADQPFRLLIEGRDGEREAFANAVLDCSGTYGRPNWAGPGGAPARGERATRTAIEYHLPDPLRADRARYEGMRTLLLGRGHSSATTALALAALARSSPETRFTWASRDRVDQPLERIPGDPLPERDELARRANALVAGLLPGSEWITDARLVGVRRSDDGFAVELEVAGALRRERFDRIVANVGYEPDDGLYRQLQIHECYASRGPMKLAAALLAAAGDGPADCLIEGGFGPETLENPEPRFFILGMKSFGKNSAFLMRTGYGQVADVFSLLARDASAL